MYFPFSSRKGFCRLFLLSLVDTQVVFLVLTEHRKLFHDFVGTDTVGCVRIPASFCGILGFRPSHGAISTIGLLPNSQSLDAIGIVKKNRDLSYVLICNVALLSRLLRDLLDFYADNSC